MNTPTPEQQNQKAQQLAALITFLLLFACAVCAIIANLTR